MKNHYYCRKCDVFFVEEGKIPDINRIHYECGTRAKLMNHVPEKKKEDG